MMLQISWWYAEGGVSSRVQKGRGAGGCVSQLMRAARSLPFSRARTSSPSRASAAAHRVRNGLAASERTDRQTDGRIRGETVSMCEWWRDAGVTRAGCCCCYGGMRMQWCIIFAWALCNVREGKRCCLVRWTLDLHCAADAAVAPLHPSLNGGIQRFMMLW